MRTITRLRDPLLAIFARFLLNGASLLAAAAGQINAA
jgi:hypothetical protein